MKEKLMFEGLQRFLGHHPVCAAAIVGLISSVIGGVIGGLILRLIP